ncbi:hypothetical protein [Reyranella sp.]|uniref:hypothetical protein n=1 Tax=Reyranella sp. TaxID=1929291 RepID=UPI003BAD9670
MTFNAFKLTLFLNELYRFLDIFDTIGGAGNPQAVAARWGGGSNPGFGMVDVARRR